MRNRLNARVRRLLLALAAPFVLAACAAGPEPIHWGVEACAHCQMVIADERFAGQVVDSRGRMYKFDAIECMAAFLNDGAVAAEDVRSAWIANGPDAWSPAETAAFVHSDNVRTPMGGGFTAHIDAASARRHLDEVGGELLTWPEVLERAAAAHMSHGDL